MIAASSVGTMIEWYDFYIFGSLAVYLSPKFYPPGNDTLALIAYLSTFVVGFIVRPFGALFFGRIGDLVGHKYAFLVTLSIMGGATAVIGLLPLVLLVFVQVIFVCMIYGPIAAYLVEAFPARIRYTSLSLPYHIGNGIFGGLLPLIGLTLCAHGQHLRWSVLSHDRGCNHVGDGQLAPEGNARHADLGRVPPGQTTLIRRPKGLRPRESCRGTIPRALLGLRSTDFSLCSP